MSFSFELRLADGDDAGTFNTSASASQVGDTLIADGNRFYRVTAVLAPERLAEFVYGAAKNRPRPNYLHARRSFSQ